MSRLEVLLVEDDPDVLEAITDELVEAGYAVVPATSAQDALARLLRGRRPAVMIIDFMMPDGTGADLSRACAADPRLAGIPTLVMSAARPRDLEAHGVGAYLQKPFHPDELLQKLKALIGPGG